MEYRVNKQKCTGCQICVNSCPGATEIGADNKARVVNQEKLENCGGESICPVGAIEKINSEEKSETENSFQPTPTTNRPPTFPRKGGRGTRNG